MMKDILVTPKGKIENKRLDPNTRFLLTKSALELPSITEANYNVSECLFNNLSIENYDDINLETINIHFHACFIERIEIDNLKTTNLTITFSHCFVGGRIAASSVKYIQMNNCLIYFSLFLLNQKKIYIEIQETSIYPRIWYKLFNKLSLGNHLEALKVKQSFHFHDCKEVKFKTDESKETSSRFYINKFQTIKSFRLGYNLSKLEKELLDTSVNITYSTNVENSNIGIVNSRLKSLQLGGILNGKISVDNTKIQHWYIRDFSVVSEAVFYNVQPISVNLDDSVLEIHKSNLDKFWFDNVDFDKYKLVSFFRTRIGKAIFTSCNFPENYASFERFKSLENVHYVNEIQDNYYKDQYETFLQLKAAMESTNNVYEAQKFLTVSNNALYKINSLSKWDKVILWFNRESNNHGGSVERPFWLFWTCGIVSYTFYLISLGYIFNNEDFNWSLWGYFFTYIDITHKPDFLVDKKCLSSLSQFIDFASKLVLGYIIFQFIAAFRKYGRSK